MTSLNEFDEYAKREIQLREVINRLQRKLDGSKRNEQLYVETLYSAVSDVLQGLVLPPVPAPKATSRTKKGAEVAVPLYSDLQLAKVTYNQTGGIDYDSSVAERRSDDFAQKIIDLADIQRSDHPVDHCHVAFLGDIIEGECIFPGQVHLIDGGLYRQITVDGPRIVVNFLRSLLTNFQTVTVDWTIGNHGHIGGRAWKDHDPETNGDRMLGRIVQMMMVGEPRITINVTDGRWDRSWYTVTEVGNWRALGIHGDQIRGHSGFPWYGLGKKVNGWASGAIPQHFDDVLMGHWHQLALIPLNKRNVYVNGSFESYNTYAQENLAAMSDPSQWLLFVHPEKGRVTWPIPVRLH